LTTQDGGIRVTGARDIEGHRSGAEPFKIKAAEPKYLRFFQALFEPL
jgi:hypothetical protein